MPELGTSGLRREARYHIPGSAGRHSKEVLWATSLPKIERSTGQQHAGTGHGCQRTLYGRSC